MSAHIAATMMGRPRIEPELSSSSVTTVSRKSVSFSRLKERGYIGSMMMRGRREVSSMPSSRSNSQCRFCCAISRRCSLLARRETTPCIGASCWSRKLRSRASSSASQRSGGGDFFVELRGEDLVAPIHPDGRKARRARLGWRRLPARSASAEVLGLFAAGLRLRLSSPSSPSVFGEFGGRAFAVLAGVPVPRLRPGSRRLRLRHSSSPA